MFVSWYARQVLTMGNSIASAGGSPLPEYEVYAIRYATRPGRRAEHFVGGDPHDGDMPMDYFIWLIKGADRSIVVDTGFTSDMATKRRRTFLRCPVDTLRALGVAPESVADVIITHLHYDLSL